jgi:hypothetical protein
MQVVCATHVWQSLHVVVLGVPVSQGSLTAGGVVQASPMAPAHVVKQALQKRQLTRSLKSVTPAWSTAVAHVRHSICVVHDPQS